MEPLNRQGLGKVFAQEYGIISISMPNCAEIMPRLCPDCARLCRDYAKIMLRLCSDCAADYAQVCQSASSFSINIFG